MKTTTTIDDLKRSWRKSEYDPDPPDMDFRDNDDLRKMISEALTLVSHYLGADYLDREDDQIWSRKHGILDLHENPEFIRPEAIYRLWSLARELTNAERIPGFPEWVRTLRTRSLREATAELRAIRHCFTHGHSVRFVNPNDHPGRSPEAYLNIDGTVTAVEVKARVAQPISEYKPGKILSTLKGATGQLPPSGPSIVYLQIVEPWARDQGVFESIQLECRRYVRNTRRVNCVVLMIERQFDDPGGDGRKFGVRYCPIPSLDARTPLPSARYLDRSWP